MDQRLALEVWIRRLVTFVIVRAHLEQLGDGVAAIRRAAAHGYGPSVTHALGDVAAPVILRRLQVPGEQEIGSAERVRGTLQGFGGRLGQIPSLRHRKIVETFGSGGERDVREIHRDRALAVDHVVVVIAAVPAFAAQRRAPVQLEDFGAPLAFAQQEAALDGNGIEAAGDRNDGLACRDFLFKRAGRTKASAKAGMVSDDLSLAGPDGDGGRRQYAGCRIYYAAADGRRRRDSHADEGGEQDRSHSTAHAPFPDSRRRLRATKSYSACPTGSNGGINRTSSTATTTMRNVETALRGAASTAAVMRYAAGLYSSIILNAA